MPESTPYPEDHVIKVLFACLRLYAQNAKPSFLQGLLSILVMGPLLDVNAAVNLNH